MDTYSFLCVEPGKEPEMRTYGTDLESLQKAVGGPIELVYPYARGDMAILCNDEGKLCHLPLNRAIKDERGTVCDVIAGTFLVVGLEGDSFRSLTEKESKEMLRLYQEPEAFYLHGSRLETISVPEQLDHTRSYAIYRPKEKRMASLCRNKSWEYLELFHVPVDAATCQEVGRGHVPEDVPITQIPWVINENGLRPIEDIHSPIHFGDILLLGYQGNTEAYAIDREGIHPYPRFFHRPECHIHEHSEKVILENHCGLWHTVESYPGNDSPLYLLESGRFTDNPLELPTYAIVTETGEIKVDLLEKPPAPEEVPHLCKMAAELEHAPRFIDGRIAVYHGHGSEREL